MQDVPKHSGMVQVAGNTRQKRNRRRAMIHPHLFLCSGGVSSVAGFVSTLPAPLQRRFLPEHRPTSGLLPHFALTTPEAIIEQASTTNLLDDLIDESVRTSARRPLMIQFDPSSGWMWRRWKGTVFSLMWDSCVFRMIYASAVFLLCKSFPQIKETLSGFSILWGQLLSVTTFTLTFFVNQSYTLWRKCSDCSRSLQGRLHDMDMTLAAHATRVPPTGPNRSSTYTPGARQMLELVSRYVRLFNLLTYASFTRSHRPVLTPLGMRRLVERGLMTPLERKVLIHPAIPATQRHNAVLLWIVRAFIEGTAAGHFKGGSGFEQQFIEKAHVCRSAYSSIGGELQGRMPLAYAHIVQVLVDLVLVLYPFMAYSSGMSWFVCVLGTGILTIGYQGLFDLAKQFLDPYDNENYGKGEDPLVVDTLIAETNAGSVRWMYGLAEMPLSPIKVQKGDLAEYLLPLRGYTVDEVKQKQKVKQALQVKRVKEELERLRREESVQGDGTSKQLNTTVSELPGADPAFAFDEPISDNMFSAVVAEQEKPMAHELLTEDDYKEQFQVLIAQSINEERLETQAILNAPPAAEGIPVLEHDPNSSHHETFGDDGTDELLVLEMDPPHTLEGLVNEFVTETVDLEAMSPAISEINGQTQAM